MFKISNPRLPTTILPRSTGAVIAAIGTPNNNALLCEIATRSTTEAIALQIPPYTGNTVEIDVSGLNLRGVEAIEIAGIRYAAATSPDNLQPGQFFWNTYTHTVTLKFKDG